MPNMKKALILTTLGLATASGNAATFLYTDFTIAGTTGTATVGGITTTVVAADTGGAATLSFLNSGTASYIGVSGPSNGQPTNVNQRNRISTGQSLTFTFSTTIRLDFLGFNNLLTAGSTETAIITSSGTGLTGLIGYGAPAVTTSQTDIPGEGLVWGYTSPAFNLQLATGNGSNVSQDVLFGVDGAQSIILNAGDTLVLNSSVGTNGGYGINSFGVTAVPEPSGTAILGLASLGLLVRRRK
jgi:hypothetical protein